MPNSNKDAHNGARNNAAAGNKRRGTKSTTTKYGTINGKVHSPTWGKKFHIPDALLAEAGVRHVTNEEARRVLGLRAPTRSNLAGDVFEYRDRDTGETKYIRVRRDEHGEGEGKYHGSSSEQSERILYSAPGAGGRLKNKKPVIVLVEAEKSALAIEAWARRRANNTVVAMAMGGCQGWRSKEHGVLPDLDVCNHRVVIVLLDANVCTNPQVREAQIELVAELRSRSCRVMTGELPDIAGVNGPDDLLAQPDGDERLAAVIAKAVEASIAPYSEHALAERFATEHKDEARYVYDLGWYAWDGHRWKHDEQGEVELLVQGLCRTAAGERGKPFEQNRIRSRRNREAILREAQAHLSVSIDALDKDTMLLNTPDGTVRLRTGKLCPALRDDYCTKMAGATPDTEKPALWLKFLNEITQGDQALQSYLQRMAGYILTGNTSENALFFLHGTGANGKSVFVNVLLAALGDYGRTAPMEVFVFERHPQHATSIAALRGARLVAANETEDGSRWAESKLKELTGGTPITARFMRQDEFTFLPQLKLLISGNHKPRLRNVDEAMRRRLHLIPFNAHFPKDKQDPALTKKLLTQLGGIVQWSIEGCLAWQHEGLNPPTVVLDATTDYFEGQDILGAWLEEATTKGKAHKTASGDLYRKYKCWAENKGEYVHGQREFIQKLVDRGFTLKKSHGVRQVGGLRLKEDGAGDTITLMPRNFTRGGRMGRVSP